MKTLLVLLVFLAGVFVGHFVIPQDDSCVWDIMEDPRGCWIAWDDGTYSWKSPICKLGTIEPGQKKTIMINPFEEIEK